MAIEYVEVRNAALEVIGILDTSQSVIWRSVYYGVGDFQVYISVYDAVELIADAKYITRPNNHEVGVIESIQITDDIESGKMITLAGRFAKSLLDRRLIYNLTNNTNTATILRGNVETNIRNLVNRNAIDTANAERSLGILRLGAVAGIDKIIVDESGYAAQKQVSYGNLLEYTEAVLKEYGMASTVSLSDKLLMYSIYQGTDRSIDNAKGNLPIIFSREYDNLLSSDYRFDSTQEKNVALIGGAGEGVERFYSLTGTASGLSRKEVFVDASSISKTYKDESDVEQTYSDAEYAEMLKALGKQTTSALNATEDFDGSIDVTYGNWVYGRDFFLGDIVTIEDSDSGIYKNARIGEVTEVQNENGYAVDAVYQGE